MHGRANCSIQDLLMSTQISALRFCRILKVGDIDRVLDEQFRLPESFSTLIRLTSLEICSDGGVSTAALRPILGLPNLGRLSCEMSAVDLRTALISLQSRNLTSLRFRGGAPHAYLVNSSPGLFMGRFKTYHYRTYIKLCANK
jgi:hypothetical protein